MIAEQTSARPRCASRCYGLLSTQRCRHSCQRRHPRAMWRPHMLTPWCPWGSRESRSCRRCPCLATTPRPLLISFLLLAHHKPTSHAFYTLHAPMGSVLVCPPPRDIPPLPLHLAHCPPLGEASLPLTGSNVAISLAVLHWCFTVISRLVTPSSPPSQKEGTLLVSRGSQNSSQWLPVHVTLTTSTVTLSPIGTDMVCRHLLACC